MSREECGHDGGRGVGAGHVCKCVRPADHSLDTDRPHGCPCGAMWKHTPDVEVDEVESLRKEVESLRKAVARTWSTYLELALSDTLDDGTPVLQLVFQHNPELRERLRKALTEPNPQLRERMRKALGGTR